MAREFHGEGRRGQQSKEYRSWTAMKKRCTYQKHPHFEKYSKLGLHCEWAKSFVTFLSDVGRAPSNAHTLDRIDTGKGYFPGNVRWATPYQQANNRSDNLIIEVDGERVTASELCHRFGIKRSTLNERIRRGYQGKNLVKPVGTFSRWNPA